MEFHIRPLTTTDEPFLWEMLYQALFVPPGHPPYPRDLVQNPEIRRYVENWGVEGDLGVIALLPENHKPIGAAWIRLLTADECGYGWVDDDTPELTIAVLPEHRGNGVGGQLMRRLIELARARYLAISLSVSIENPARRLYERFGFQRVSEDRHAVTMKRELKHSGSNVLSQNADLV